MKNYRSSSSPLRQGIFLSDAEIESTCEDALREVGLYPAGPQPLRIERFVEKRFNVTPRYEDMPDAVLGFSCFDRSGMTSMHISKALLDGGTVGERRALATIAHEAGHGLFHGPYLALDAEGLSLFGEDPDVTRTKILCRHPQQGTAAKKAYDGRWWEVQANRAIGPLLMPPALVKEAVKPHVVKRGTLVQMEDIPREERESVVRLLAETFEVNPAVARIRLEAIYPPSVKGQLTL